MRLLHPVSRDSTCAVVAGHVQYRLGAQGLTGGWAHRRTLRVQTSRRQAGVCVLFAKSINRRKVRSTEAWGAELREDPLPGLGTPPPPAECDRNLRGRVWGAVRTCAVLWKAFGSSGSTWSCRWARRSGAQAVRSPRATSPHVIWRACVQGKRPHVSAKRGLVSRRDVATSE